MGNPKANESEERWMLCLMQVCVQWGCGGARWRFHEMRPAMPAWRRRDRRKPAPAQPERERQKIPAPGCVFEASQDILQEMSVPAGTACQLQQSNLEHM